MKRRNRKWLKIALVILDVLLIGALLMVFRLENGREAKTARIRQKALDKFMSAQTAAADSENADTLSGEESIAVIPSVLSIRGDSFQIPGGDPQTSYPAILQQLLADEGSNIRVIDYTLDKRSVLTHLYYAGVPSSDISAFIERNRESERAADSDVELTAGNVSGLVTERKDLDAIPIIFTGYYGGWGGNVYELIEMQKKILETYNQQEYYIIVGTHPYNVTDFSEFDSIMQGYWGTHYLGVTKIAGSALTTLTGHQQLAERIVQKLRQQGIYVTQEETAFAAFAGQTTAS